MPPECINHDLVRTGTGTLTVELSDIITGVENPASVPDKSKHYFAINNKSPKGYYIGITKTRKEEQRSIHVATVGYTHELQHALINSPHQRNAFPSGLLSHNHQTLLMQVLYQTFLP